MGVRGLCALIATRCLGSTQFHPNPTMRDHLPTATPTPMNHPGYRMWHLVVRACHVPRRAGWRPNLDRMHAVLSNVITERWSDKSRTEKVPCQTWDNATLLMETTDPASGDVFPWTLRTCRIAPGEKNSWYVQINGERACARWNSREPKILERLHDEGGGQTWRRMQTGCDTPHPTISGPIFEFGSSPMLCCTRGIFVHEPPSLFTGCVRPEETILSHEISTAALRARQNARSGRTGQPQPAGAAG